MKVYKSLEKKASALRFFGDPLLYLDPLVDDMQEGLGWEGRALQPRLGRPLLAQLQICLVLSQHCLNLSNQLRGQPRLHTRHKLCGMMA